MIIHHTSSAEMIACMKFVWKVKVQIHHLGADLLRRSFIFGVSKIHQRYTWTLGAFDDFNSRNSIKTFVKKSFSLRKTMILFDFGTRCSIF